VWLPGLTEVVDVAVQQLPGQPTHSRFGSPRGSIAGIV
jgi:hypothetical protein